MPQQDSHPFYRAVLKLYPRAHRQEYAEQMLQTFDDLLSDQQDVSGRWQIWLRVALELPSNLAEEHIDNIRSASMNGIRQTRKKVMVAVAVIGVIALAIVLTLILSHHQYQPTTLSKVPRANTLPACVQNGDNPSLSVKADDKTFIVNSVATSIIDVPAGTNVDVYLKSYDAPTATGTAVYSDKYGSYNFTAKNTSSNSSDNYAGGWTITHLEACKV